MNNPDDRFDFRPRMGKRQRACDRVGSSPVRVGMLVRRGHGRSIGRLGKGKGLPPTTGFGPRYNARRVVVKAHVQRLTDRGAQAARRHLRYIERDGVEKDGSPGVLYGPEGPVPRERFEQPRVDERHQFRFILSPEEGRDLELTGYVRELMRRVERDLGRRIEWAAVNHHDTDYPHAHVVVRGVDLEGRPMRMGRAYIARGLRWTAQGLATELLGPRLELEIRQTREREVTQERFTSLDRELERTAPNRRVDLSSIVPHRGGPARDLLVRRLEQLHHLGLAAPASEGAWVLVEGWQAELRRLGERGDILKEVHRAMGGVTTERLHVLRPGQGLPDGRGGVNERALVARVVRVGLTDEHKGTFSALLETSSGKAYYVPISARSVDTLRAGDLVSFRTQRESTIGPIDRHIAEVAASRGGVYLLADETGAARDARAADARLREFERVGLAVARGPGCWAVPADLLQQLDSRSRATAARYRLSIERLSLSLDAQATHRGPVWLDSVDPATLAKSGLGAQVMAALEQRRRCVRSFGIDPDHPRRDDALRDLERRTVGGHFAEQTGEQFLEVIPAHFQGRMEPAPVRTGYAVVSDGARFVLLPATPETRAFAGKTVEVARDGQGRFLGLRSLDRGPER